MFDIFFGKYIDKIILRSRKSIYKIIKQNICDKKPKYKIQKNPKFLHKN